MNEVMDPPTQNLPSGVVLDVTRGAALEVGTFVSPRSCCERV
jgi:hypothetical protein